MIKKTLYFGNPAYLSLKDDQLVVRLPEVEKVDDLPEIIRKSAVRTIPIEDIGFVVLDHRQITITHGLIEKLLDYSVAVMSCSCNGMPQGMLLPLAGNTIQNERFRSQLDASVPLKKQLWQQTVQRKIENQAIALARCSGIENRCMLTWSDEVKSGDSTNVEARAAVYYWKNFFPMFPDFIRNREGDCPNNLLNYGYAILRAVVARSLVVSGLLPTLGIHHHNRYNAYCLADDIMEPYRPFVDELVYNIVNELDGNIELDRSVKAKLLVIPTLDVKINERKSPLMIAVGQTTASLVKCFRGEMRKISYPEFV